MASAGQNDDSGIRQKDTGVFAALSEQERAWLRDHPVISMTPDPDWPPVEFTDDRGEQSGMAMDYLKLVEQRLGMEFVRVTSLSWQEAYSRLKRFAIDMTTSVAVTPEREEFWAFTKPYMTIPIVIATSSDVTYIADMRELAGKKVAVVEGYAVSEWIPRDYPEIQLVRVKTTNEGLDLLQQGEVFAYIDNLLVIGYYHSKMEVTNIKIAGQTPYVNAQCMAVRKDWAILSGILQKALDSISETERNDIYRKWLPIRFEHGFDYTRFWWVPVIFTVIILAQVLWIRKLSREISHRKQVEERLNYNEQLLREMGAVAKIGAWEFDVATGKGTWTEEVSGIHEVDPNDETSVERGLSFYQNESRRRIEQAVKEAIEFGKSYTLQLELTTAKGRHKWVETIGHPTVKNGKTVRVRGSFQDISERKRIELELNKHHEHLEGLVNERTTELHESQLALMNIVEDLNTKSQELAQTNLTLKEIDRLKSMFIASMSHELRTPLNSVIGFSSILIKEWVGPLNDEQKMNLTSILRSGKHLLSLINDVIDVSKIEAGMIEVSREEFDLAELLAEVEQAFAKDAQERKLSLSIQPLRLPMYTDRRRLLQCLLNLVSNALKFTVTGKVSVTVRYDETEGKVRFSVTDTGIGIGAEDQARLFQAFSRIPSELSAKVLGTGLGLYLTKKIVVEILHGEITVASEPGRGSTFSIIIPSRIEEDQGEQRILGASGEEP